MHGVVGCFQQCREHRDTGGSAYPVSVDIVGLVGAILQGALNAWVSHAFGWRAVFLVLVGLAFAAAVALVPTFRRDDSG